MLFINDTRCLAPLALLLLSAVAQAQDPIISEITVDNDGPLQIMIKGTALSTGSDAVVSLGNVGTLSVDSQTTTDVVVSAVSPVPVGDYRLTLTTSVGTVAYDLTIAAAEAGGSYPSPVKLVEGPSITAVGLGALANNTTGVYNSALGLNALSSNTEGTSNTASGVNALLLNTTGNNNTASGVNALLSNTEGSFNTASGLAALQSNTSGSFNTASGVGALFSNTTGENNTASGVNALFNNTNGYNNTASGAWALSENTSGWHNTASGVNALSNNTTGDNNTVSGVNALFDNTTGSQNTASGSSALKSNTTGYNNTASGLLALTANTTGYGNAAYGAFALVGSSTGSQNIALGFTAGYNLTTGSHNIAIGNTGDPADSETIRIGDSQSRAFMAGINGSDQSTGKPVYISAAGQLGTGAAAATRHVVLDGNDDPVGDVSFWKDENNAYVSMTIAGHPVIALLERRYSFSDDVNTRVFPQSPWFSGQPLFTTPDCSGTPYWRVDAGVVPKVTPVLHPAADTERRMYNCSNAPALNYCDIYTTVQTQSQTEIVEVLSSIHVHTTELQCHSHPTEFVEVSPLTYEMRWAQPDGLHVVPATP